MALLFSFPTRIQILIFLLATLLQLPFTLSSASPDPNPQGDYGYGTPPPNNNNDGYGNPPPGGGSPPPAQNGNPLGNLGGLFPSLTAPYWPGFPFPPTPTSTPISTSKTAGGVVVPPPHTPSSISTPSLPGYTFNPPPPPPPYSVSTPGGGGGGITTLHSTATKTTTTFISSHTNDGITGPPNSTPTNPGTCASPSLSLSLVTNIGVSSYTTRIYTMTQSLVTTVITQEVAVTLTSVIVVPFTSVSTLTHSVCAGGSSGVLTTGTVGGVVTGPGGGGSSGGGGGSSTVGGGGGGSSTCVWGAPVTTGGYVVNFSPVVAGVSDLGVSDEFGWSFWMGRISLYYAQSQLAYAEYKCQLQCGAGCESFYVGYSPSTSSFICTTYTSLIKSTDLIPLTSSSPVSLGVAFNKLCSSSGGGGGVTPTSSLPGGPGYGGGGGFTTLPASSSSVVNGGPGGGYGYLPPPPPPGGY